MGSFWRKIRIQGEGMLCPFWTVESEVPEQQAEAEFTKLGMPEWWKPLSKR